MNDALPRNPSRRKFLILGGATVAAVALVDVGSIHASSAGTAGCSAGSCTTTTAWMLDPDWGYPRGPHAKTRLISRASREAAANRIARTQADALNMNLHPCSWAPAVGIDLCSTRVDAAFESYASNWDNPWNATTVSLVDRRWLPADYDLVTCPASSPHAQPTSSQGNTPATPGQSMSGLGVETSAGQAGAGTLAFTGSSDRRLLFAGVGAVLAGAILRTISRPSSSAIPASNRSDDTEPGT